MKQSLIHLVQQLLSTNKIHFEKSEIDFQIQSHPSYPSLHAVTGVLDHFNIENVALNVPANEETFLQLPKTFLAQVKSDKGEHFVLVKKKKLNLKLVVNNKETNVVSVSEFLELFTGIIVAVEKEETQQENKILNTVDLKKWIIVLFGLVFIGHFSFLATNVWIISYFALSLIGVFISSAILKQELGENSLLGNAFCSGETESKSCDDVLTSKGAKIFQNFKLSDLSLVYFLGLVFTCYLLSLSKNNYGLITVLSFLAIPITLYSIYYQYAVVKKWCLLCLSIVVVLWGQIALVANNFQNVRFSVNTVLIGLLSFLLPLVIWNIISPLLKDQKGFKNTKIDYFKFKRNFNLFNTLLNTSSKIDTALTNTKEIVFGNQNAALQMVIITNPFCGHCKAVHTLLENILKAHKETVRICVRFNIDTSNPDSDIVKISTRLLELYENEGEIACLKAMHDIYNGQEVSKWIKGNGECTKPAAYTPMLETEKLWCKSNSINFTPELLINGKSYPKEYDRSELIYFIDELKEYYLKNTTESILFTQ